MPSGSVPASDVIVERGAVAIEEFADGDDSGRGMMDGHGAGWKMLVPIGIVTAILGVLGRVVYWAGQTGDW